MRRIRTAFLVMLAVFAALCLAPASGAEQEKGDLTEAYYLGKCAASGWWDAEAFERLKAATEDNDRLALYLLNRMFALQSLSLQPPVIAEIPWASKKKRLTEEMVAVDAELDSLDERLLAWASTVHSGSEAERYTGALTLGAFSGDELGADLLVTLLNDQSAFVRGGTCACISKGQANDTARELAPFLAVRVLTDAFSSKRERAAEALGYVVGVDFPSEDPVPAATEWIRDHYDTSVVSVAEGDAPATRSHIAERESLAEAYYLAECAASGWMDDEAFARLLDSVESERRRAFYLVDRALYCTGALHHSYLRIAASPAALEERHRELQEKSQQALAAVREMGPVALYAWARYVRSGSEDVRRIAAWELGELAEDEKAVDLLILLLNDQSDSVRSSAATRLEMAYDSAAARGALPFLAVHMLYDPGFRMREACAQAIGEVAGQDFPDMSKFLPTQRTVDAATEWVREHYDLSRLPPPPWEEDQEQAADPETETHNQ
ncbi:MAG: HEAT repeat domain-containing protein [Candidatus Brocadiia bacterium]